MTGKLNHPYDHPTRTDKRKVGEDEYQILATLKHYKDMKDMKEAINQMKLCPLCLSNDEWPYTETHGALHQEQGLHSRLGYTWKPEKGHKDYDLHKRLEPHRKESK